MVCLIFSTVIFMVLNSNIDFILNNNIENREVYQDEFSIYLNQLDLTGPNITFIQPNLNGTIIETKSYEIIVNITDELPILSENVRVQISNFTNLLINASMTSSGGDIWTYNWENLSTYVNRIFYIIRVWAKDSSPNGTSSLSEAWYVYLYLPRRINLFLLRNILYIIAVSLISAAICFYINKKQGKKLSSKQK